MTTTIFEQFLKKEQKSCLLVKETDLHLQEHFLHMQVTRLQLQETDLQVQDIACTCKSLISQ